MESRTDPSYDLKIQREQEIYADQIKVHDLPQIFHYWSNKHLKPLVDLFGYHGIDDLFVQGFMKAGQRATQRKSRFMSVGAGNCDTEVRVAGLLAQLGLEDFTIECLDINGHMLERGKELAKEAGVADKIVTVQSDINSWKPLRSYDAVMANQSLHHVVNLEGLLDSVRNSLSPGGLFVVSDIIGRNGHQRWPEALEILNEFWSELPHRYKYNLQLRRQEDKFMDWDCTNGGGFEGVRAQDILGLLVERFNFDYFLGFSNVIDPFIDRGFGHHFDANAEWDRNFIDRVHARDESEILAGRIKPAHMLAVMQREAVLAPRYWKHLTAQFCVRETPHQL